MSHQSTQPVVPIPGCLGLLIVFLLLLHSCVTGH